MNRKCLIFCFMLLGALALQANLQAQDFVDKLVREQREEKSAEFPEIKEHLYFDLGFWYKFGFYHYELPGSGFTEHGHTLRTHSLYAWSDFVLDKTHRLYARVNTLSLDYSKGDGARRDHRIYKPRLDMGFYEYRTEKEKGVEDPVKKFRFRLGRQLLKLGSGFTYSKVHDGISTNISLEILDTTFFFAQSIPSENNIDQSKPGSKRQRRNFYGAQVELKRWANHTPYVYLLLQRDRQGENPDMPWANYIFHSNYFAIGSKGSIGKNVKYHAECILCSGQRHADSFFMPLCPKENIRARGFDSKIEYVLGGPMNMVFALQYMFGSGDKDRISPTDTDFGNESGTDDKVFVPFGHAETGYALYPLVANLHVYRLSFSFMPLKRDKTFSKLRLGAALIDLQKDKRGGGISTRVAQALENKDVGWEFDLFAHWEVYSDLLLTVKYGHFQPVNAFARRSAFQGGMRRQLDYFFLGMTYSF